MRFLEFGDKNNKAILLIHGYGISWKMWTPQIDFFSKEYFVIVPILPGYDLEKNSTFTTVQQVSTDIANHVIETYGVQVYAICGASLGATIAIDILVQSKLKVAKAIIDCGPVVPMNKLLLSFAIKARIRQAHKMKKNPEAAKKMFYNSFFPSNLVDEILKIGANMKDESCRNAHLSVYNYSLPKSFVKCKTDIAYWYGSKEAIFGKKYSKAVLALKPDTKVKAFKGLEHGELCIGYPELYIKEVIEFFNSNDK